MPLWQLMHQTFHVEFNILLLHKDAEMLPWNDVGMDVGGCFLSRKKKLYEDQALRMASRSPVAQAEGKACVAFTVRQAQM